jgi:hypothetical protein
MRSLGVAFLLLLLCRPLAAQSAELPAFLVRGFEAYEVGDAERAIDIWAQDAPFASQRANVLPGLKAIQEAIGQMVGYEVLWTVTLSSRARRYYVCIFHERGPAYASFDVYDRGSTALLSGFLINTKPETILPAGFFLPGV